MKIGIMKSVEVEAKTLKIHLKVCDQFCAELVDQDGQQICIKDDIYVPDFMPGEHYGDYVMLDIDIDSGQVVNWQKPTEDQLNTFINDGE